MSTLLRKASFRFYLKHPIQLLLIILGMATGVAMVVSIDLANQSALRSFQVSAQTVLGKTTHRITAVDGFMPDSLFRDLVIQTEIKAAPILEEYVIGDWPNNQTLHLLGIDPFSEPPFRDFNAGGSAENTFSFGDFLSGQPLAYADSSFLEKHSLNVGNWIRFSFAGRHDSLLLAGLLQANSAFQKGTLDATLVADISALQQVMSVSGKLSHIDLILNEEQEQQIHSFLRGYGAGVQLTSASDLSRSKEKMIAAFQLNLGALSLLGLVVAVFLIFQLQSFSVIQRKALFGRLRCLGVDSKQIFYLLMVESLSISLVGIFIGLIGGTLLAQVLVGFVTQTINDLYFVTEVNRFDISAWSLARAALFGFGAGLIGSIYPAKEAASNQPVTQLSRISSHQEEGMRIKQRLLLALLLTTLGTIVLLFWDNVMSGYVGAAFFLGAFVFVVAPLVFGIVGLLDWLFIARLDFITRMAWRSVRNSLRRTGLAVTALAIALSAFVGLTIMVTSFRTTVSYWLENVLAADVYITAPSLSMGQRSSRVSIDFAKKLASLEGVVSVGMVRRLSLPVNDDEESVNVLSIQDANYASFVFKESILDAWSAFEQGAVFISEPMAYKKGWQIGDSLSIQTPKGFLSVAIAGIIYDYASEKGTVSMHWNALLSHLDLGDPNGVSLFVESGNSVDEIITLAKAQQPEQTAYWIRSNTSLLNDSLAIFDRTFAITFVLQVLVAGVAFVGVICALLGMAIEKQSEFGVLRAAGFSPGQLFRLIVEEATAIGFLAAIFSIPLGLILAYILVYFINLQSFGWSLIWVSPPELFVQTFLIGLGASFLAGLYPAWKILQLQPQRAILGE